MTPLYITELCFTKLFLCHGKWPIVIRAFLIWFQQILLNREACKTNTSHIMSQLLFTEVVV